jgi:hypothetical protein
MYAQNVCDAFIHPHPPIRHLREMFKIDTADYMLSICGNSGLRELSSPGKSGSVFYISHDDRFMIKTMRKAEVKVRRYRESSGNVTHGRENNICCSSLRCITDSDHFLEEQNNVCSSQYIVLIQITIINSSKIHFFS